MGRGVNVSHLCKEKEKNVNCAERIDVEKKREYSEKVDKITD